ncbi:carbohydrate kinase family protein [Herbiconiux ginsengi]|uniref:Sugar or nucleoside kinase, ribokinase family n=1 Tax=Herbiconiux ginsengi TaxID=381665 RepID=A0A1H3Q1K0_9MICO|nr:PfkB family carbohydrate kinase [Herbiconiux ginsengi]SDZ07103.1 Sugar or nucleoside kinase, ribokinase family [Herbiconiux ginsengi]
MTDPRGAAPHAAAPHVCVFGDVFDDLIVTPSGAIRADTDTTARIERQAGGSAANAAAWFAHLGCRVDFAGHVNVDDVARHENLLRQHGVTPHLAGADLPTGTIVVILQPDRTRTMLTERGANALTSPADVDRALFRTGGHLHFTGYSVFRHGAPDATHAFAALVQEARAAGVSVSVNPGSAGFIATHGAGSLLAAMAGATVVLPNLDEGRALTGAHDPDDVVTALLERHEIVALTLGRAGALVASRAPAPARPHGDAARSSGAPGPVDGSTRVHVAAVPVAPVDTTGAGDAFGAGFVDSLLRSGAMTADAMDAPRLEAAARAGVAGAALAVTHVGGRPPVPDAAAPSAPSTSRAVRAAHP